MEIHLIAKPLLLCGTFFCCCCCFSMAAAEGLLYTVAGEGYLMQHWGALVYFLCVFRASADPYKWKHLRSVGFFFPPVRCNHCRMLVLLTGIAQNTGKQKGWVFSDYWQAGRLYEWILDATARLSLRNDLKMQTCDTPWNYKMFITLSSCHMLSHSVGAWSLLYLQKSNFYQILVFLFNVSSVSVRQMADKFNYCQDVEIMDHLAAKEPDISPQKWILALH